MSKIGCVNYARFPKSGHILCLKGVQVMVTISSVKVHLKYLLYVESSLSGKYCYNFRLDMSELLGKQVYALNECFRY